MKTISNIALDLAESSSKPLFKRYHDLKVQRDRELAALWNKAVQSEKEEAQKFLYNLREELSLVCQDIIVGESSRYFSGYIINLPYDFCSGIGSREIFSYDSRNNKLTLRDAKEGNCFKTIQFNKETSPSRIAKYVLKYQRRILEKLGKLK
jgi:hypothetical protein